MKLAFETSFFAREMFSPLNIPDQFFSADPVVIESICDCMSAKRLISEGNTSGGLKKIGRDLSTIWKWVRVRVSYLLQCQYKKSLSLPSFFPVVKLHIWLLLKLLNVKTHTIYYSCTFLLVQIIYCDPLIFPVQIFFDDIVIMIS